MEEARSRSCHRNHHCFTRDQGALARAQACDVGPCYAIFIICGITIGQHVITIGVGSGLTIALWVYPIAQMDTIHNDMTRAIAGCVIQRAIAIGQVTHIILNQAKVHRAVAVISIAVGRRLTAEIQRDCSAAQTCGGIVGQVGWVYAIIIIVRIIIWVRHGGRAREVIFQRSTRREFVCWNVNFIIARCQTCEEIFPICIGGRGRNHSPSAIQQLDCHARNTGLAAI